MSDLTVKPSGDIFARVKSGDKSPHSKRSRAWGWSKP